MVQNSTSLQKQIVPVPNQPDHWNECSTANPSEKNVMESMNPNTFVLQINAWGSKRKGTNAEDMLHSYSALFTLHSAFYIPPRSRQSSTRNHPIKHMLWQQGSHTLRCSHSTLHPTHSSLFTFSLFKLHTLHSTHSTFYTLR